MTNQWDGKSEVFGNSKLASFDDRLAKNIAELWESLRGPLADPENRRSFNELVSDFARARHLGGTTLLVEFFQFLQGLEAEMERVIVRQARFLEENQIWLDLVLADYIQALFTGNEDEGVKQLEVQEGCLVRLVASFIEIQVADHFDPVFTQQLDETFVLKLSVLLDQVIGQAFVEERDRPVNVVKLRSLGQGGITEPIESLLFDYLRSVWTLYQLTDNVQGSPGMRYYRQTKMVEEALDRVVCRCRFLVSQSEFS